MTPNDIQHERELREAWQRAHELLHTSDKEALLLARKDVDRRLTEMNELREQITSERGEYVRRDFYDEQHNRLRVDTDSRLKILETSKSNMEGRMWMMGAAISGAVIILNLAMRYFLGK